MTHGSYNESISSAKSERGYAASAAVNAMNEKFLTNLTQLKRAVALEPVERIPFAPCGPAFFPLDGGITLKTAATDFETASKVNLAEHIKYNATCTQADIFIPYMLSTFWLSKVSVPGVDLEIGRASCRERV